MQISHCHFSFVFYDWRAVKREEDDPKDAIIYFYPHTVSIDDQCNLCGQLMGMVRFFKTYTGLPPRVIQLENGKYVFKHIPNYSLALGSNFQQNEAAMLQQLELLYQVFCLLQGDLANIRQTLDGYGNGSINFLLKIKEIWDSYLPLCSQFDILQQTLEVVPTLHLAKKDLQLFLNLSALLENCQRRPGVLAGAVLFKNRVVCSQLTPDLIRTLLAVQSHLQEICCHDVQVDFKLPDGVKVVKILINKERYLQLRKSVFRSRNQHCLNSEFADKGDSKIHHQSAMYSDSEMTSSSDLQRVSSFEADRRILESSFLTERKLSANYSSVDSEKESEIPFKANMVESEQYHRTMQMADSLSLTDRPMTIVTKAIVEHVPSQELVGNAAIKSGIDVVDRTAELVQVAAKSQTKDSAVYLLETKRKDVVIGKNTELTSAGTVMDWGNEGKQQKGKDDDSDFAVSNLESEQLDKFKQDVDCSQNLETSKHDSISALDKRKNSLNACPESKADDGNVELHVERPGMSGECEHKAGDTAMRGGIIGIDERAKSKQPFNADEENETKSAAGLAEGFYFHENRKLDMDGKITDMSESHEPKFEENCKEEVLKELGHKSDPSLSCLDEDPSSAEVELALYVQAHSDSTLLCLLEKNMCNLELILALVLPLLQCTQRHSKQAQWKTALAKLGDLDFHFTRAMQPQDDIQAELTLSRILKYDKLQQNLMGMDQNYLIGASNLDKVVLDVRDCFRKSEVMTDVTLGNHSTCTYGHQNPSCEMFLQKSFDTPFCSSPQANTLLVAMENTARRYFKEKQDMLLV